VIYICLYQNQGQIKINMSLKKSLNFSQKINVSLKRKGLHFGREGLSMQGLFEVEP